MALGASNRRLARAVLRLRGQLQADIEWYENWLEVGPGGMQVDIEPSLDAASAALKLASSPAGLDLERLAERYRVAALLALEALDDFKGTVEYWSGRRYRAG